jgi:hypothetical protein
VRNSHFSTDRPAVRLAARRITENRGGDFIPTGAQSN